MRTSVGKSPILRLHRNVLQLITTSNRFFEHLESLFLDTTSLSDDFLLRQGRETSWRSHHRQSIDIDGFPSEILDAREERSLSRDWLSRFESADALIFVVPLSAYCQTYPASASPVSERSTLSRCIVR